MFRLILILEKSVLWCLESLWCPNLSLESKNELKITEENFTKFAGPKLVFYPISTFFSWKIWWNEVKDQFQSPKFDEIFFSHFTSIFQFWYYMETPEGLWTPQHTFSKIRISRNMQIWTLFLGQNSHFCQKSDAIDRFRHY